MVTSFISYISIVKYKLSLANQWKYSNKTDWFIFNFLTTSIIFIIINYWKNQNGCLRVDIKFQVYLGPSGQKIVWSDQIVGQYHLTIRWYCWTQIQHLGDSIFYCLIQSVPRWSNIHHPVNLSDQLSHQIRELDHPNLTDVTDR